MTAERTNILSEAEVAEINEKLLKGYLGVVARITAGDNEKNPRAIIVVVNPENGRPTTINVRVQNEIIDQKQLHKEDLVTVTHTTSNDGSHGEITDAYGTKSSGYHIEFEKVCSWSQLPEHGLPKTLNTVITLARAAEPDTTNSLQATRINSGTNTKI